MNFSWSKSVFWYLFSVVGSSGQASPHMVLTLATCCVRSVWVAYNGEYMPGQNLRW
jgi:hypothetical protein